MAITNHERVGKSMDLLKAGLAPFIEREMKSQYQAEWLREAKEALTTQQLALGAARDDPLGDVAAMLALMTNRWQEVFRRTLGQAERALVSEVRTIRNNWAHQRNFSTDDAYRALDSVHRLLLAVSAPQASEIEQMKMELLRVRFDEQVRSERRKTSGTTIESAATGGLKPWREIVTPHKDVASGRYQQAEFAADLWQVHLGEGTDEYRDPVEFFRRTFLTDSLKQLLASAMERLSGKGGDPVVQLQTNFGGGKTHSMLALYHLFSGRKPTELAGVEAVMTHSEIKALPSVRRVVLVGNKISPGNPAVKADGTVVRTLWGELAWQLGFAAGGIKEAKKAFARIAADDERATNPGDALRELFNTYGPCLILIDEWVAYARQLHDQSDLPAGSFETQFSFAQALTESAKLARACLLVISLPASDTATSPHAQADDVEVGGERGRDALARLRNVVGRLESSWRPASAEEGFEIVRRRLFEPLTDPAQFRDRDVVARAFADLYHTQHQEFPPECRDANYETRLKAAYPIHPEIFDRLYGDWSTLVKFQRTRGVLRLMAAVIHSLWEKGDRNPLILPANVAIDDPRVQFELTRYLPDNWPPVIETDVDSPNSLPLRMDGELPNLGKYHACRRVARTIYLGSAPTQAAAHRGIEDRRIKLGCVMPGESPAVFGDALRRLAAVATYLYQDGPRYWYSTQPTVTKLAEDRAEQLKRDSDKVITELDARLRTDLRKTGDFDRIHVCPHSGQDVPDDMDARLVVLNSEHPYNKDPECPALRTAKLMFESRGNAPRLFRNTLVFLAVDQARLQDLDDAVRRFLAWESIVNERETLNLDPHQLKQAETQKVAADGAVVARLPEAYQWLLVPTQGSPKDEMKWESIRLTGADSLAVRVSKKLKYEELLITALAGTRLRLELDQIPLWRGNHVSIRQLAEDFARYTYLPRLKDTEVLLGAVRDGLGLLLWRQDSFAYADSFDEATNRYLGLRSGQVVSITPGETSGLLVRSSVAAEQLDREQATTAAAPTPTPADPSRPDTRTTSPEERVDGKPTAKLNPTRYYGTVVLDSARVGRDAGRIADEVIAHLAGLMASDVMVTLEIDARVPGGVPENVVRIVTENGRTLKFSNQGFERE
jgi:predicted AAA+ superfamily ATPase